MARKKNLFGKTRKTSEPYAEYSMGKFTFRVLKTYKHADNEANDPHARWFLATSSPYTFGTWELGDGYARDIRPCTLVKCTREWEDAYGRKPEDGYID